MQPQAIASAHQALDQLQRDIERQQLELTEKGTWGDPLQSELEQIRHQHGAARQRIADAEAEWSKSGSVVEQEIAALRSSFERWVESVDARFAQPRNAL